MSSNHLFLPRNVVESVIQHFDSLISATSVKQILEHHRQIAKHLHYETDGGIRNFFKLKCILNVKSLSKWNKVASILKALDQKANQKEYATRSRFQEKKVLVIGGGISGLRVAIELLLVGVNVICVEKRDEFSRNNVIHLWPNVINDMYTFEAKRLYGQFCVGSIDHISIRQLQLILLKIAILYGLKFVPNVAFEEICPRVIEPNECICVPETCNCCCHSHGFGGGAYAHFRSPHMPSVVQELNKESFDVIIGCDGRRNTFSRYFPRNNRRGKLAIGLTANFVNRRTEEEAHCPEISGISRIYNQKWFKDLQDETGIELENLVYYRDETHYFVMTATKTSLLRRGVLKCDYSDSHALLSTSNIDISMLMKYSKDAAEWSSKLRRLEFALNSSNKPDVALFDFTSMYSATNASCAKKTHLKCCKDNIRSNASSSKYTLMMLCGDSLLEPFWPTGSGAGRGFLSAIDAAWTVSLWYNTLTDETADIDSMLNVICRREYVYRLLAQTSPENTTAKNFTLDPQTRYKNLNLRDSKILTEIKNQVRHLIIDKNDLVMKNYMTSYEAKRARRATVGINPDDVIKAKHLSYQPINAFDDLNEVLPAFSNNKSLYKVPSACSAKKPILNCDNQPIEVIELKPKNSTYDYTPSHIDFKPRNNDPSSFKRNYQARNHFLGSDVDELASTGSTSNTDYSNKENSYSHQLDLLNSKQLSGSTYNEDDKNKYLLSSFQHLYPVKANTTVQNNDAFSELNLRPHKYYTEHAQNHKPKKSSDIIEKAQYLEQKFEEQKKPYTPKLTKVGKIEEEDWNVKMWNSTDIFAAKVTEKKNMVFDNSKELLQSRIKQLNNNFSNSHKEDLLKSTPKNKVTKEYVNMLSNEVAQKFNNSAAPKTQEPLKSVELLKATDATDGTCPSELITKRTPNLKTVELLRPSGECKRCNQTVTVIDRVSVLGQNYHKTCLTCKACSVMLRQDEILNDHFICKICLKSRASNSQSDARNSFFNNQLSVSLIESIEAKKNFLVNIEQIDLRERAEFEIVDESDDSKEADSATTSTEQPPEPVDLATSQSVVESSPQNEPIDFDESSSDNLNDLQDNKELTSSQSSLSESDEHLSASHSDSNYTDDEHSESDDVIEPDKDDDFSLRKVPLLKEEAYSQLCEMDDLVPEQSNDASEGTESFSNVDSTNSDHCSRITDVPEQHETSSVTPDNPLLLSAISNEPVFTTSNSPYLTYCNPTCQSYPNSDSSLVLERMPNPTLIDRAFGSSVTRNKAPLEQAKDKRPEQAIGKSTGLPYRYSGQFTEKLYRTLSQPTLYEQLNLIDRKLKRSTVLPPLSHEDLPFADSHEDLCMTQSAVFPDKLPNAPVAKIEDI